MPEFLLKISPLYSDEDYFRFNNAVQLKIAVKIADRIVDLHYGVKAEA